MPRGKLSLGKFQAHLHNFFENVLFSKIFLKTANGCKMATEMLSALNSLKQKNISLIANLVLPELVK